MPSSGSGGFLLSLLTESFAVRALLGSLAAAGLAALVVATGAVRTVRARRLLVLTPVLVAAAAAVASVGEAFLPQLWVGVGITTTSAAGQLLELLAELRVVPLRRDLDLLVVAYAAVATVLLARRVTGLLAVRRLLRGATPCGRESRDVVALLRALARQMDAPQPRVRLLEGCPGGAFAVGAFRPVVVLDPELLTMLDEHELEGLLAHELAHVRRRDPLLGLVVGIFRDLTFFLPPIHLARRWLGREQEESADELAALHTRRPAALASGILKVWDAGSSRAGLRMSCAAVAAGAGTAGARVVTARVERLITAAPGVSVRRRRAETALAAAVLAAGSAAGLLVPGWLATVHGTYSLSFGYLALSETPEVTVESPAFATFRRLAPPPEPPAAETPSLGLPAPVDDTVCPCVETQAQLRGGFAATTPARERMLWHSADHDPWRYLVGERPGVAPARPLWTLTDSGPQVGFFLVGRPV